VGQGEGLSERLAADREAQFPDLAKAGYRVTSQSARNYNCVAYAAGDETRKWDSGGLLLPGYYWPPGAMRGHQIEALQCAFATLGYEPFDTGDPEEGYEKVALDADENGHWQHVARQLPGGHWASKLGDCEDILHTTVHALCSPVYGTVWGYMKRPTGAGSDRP